MINKWILQKLQEDKPQGFTRKGGLMRMYMSILDVTSVDFVDTLDYCEYTGLIEKTGKCYPASGGVEYNWIGK